MDCVGETVWRGVDWSTEFLTDKREAPPPLIIVTSFGKRAAVGSACIRYCATTNLKFPSCLRLQRFSSPEVGDWV